MSNTKKIEKNLIKRIIKIQRNLKIEPDSERKKTCQCKQSNAIPSTAFALSKLRHMCAFDHLKHPSFQDRIRLRRHFEKDIFYIIGKCVKKKIFCC